MSSRARIGARTGHPELVDVSVWPEVDEDALSDDRRKVYRQRRQAISLYLDGASDADLQSATGLRRNNVRRIIVDRCLRQHADGSLEGWRGAIFNARVKSYHRSSPLNVQPNGGGAAGALTLLFESPGGSILESDFQKAILGKRPKLASTKLLKQQAYIWLIKKLRLAGYEARGEWPFNVESMGYASIYKYIQRVLDEHPKRQLQLLGGPDAERKALAGDGTERPVFRPFERVECDGHKLDSRMVLLVPSPDGGFVSRKIHRLWVIVIIEVASRAVLGYYLSLRYECTADDVLRAIKHSLTRWQRKDLQFSENAYVEGAGLPSSRQEKYIGACWDQMSADGALANICKRVERQLFDVVGSSLLKPQDPNCFASRRSKDDRPYIETFFRRLAGGGLHRLSTTTGGKPKDKRGANPDAAAKATQFQLEYAEELLDTLIANYNATPHSGVSSRSPMAHLDFLCGRQRETIRQADPADVRRLVAIRDLRTVLGGENSGRRPHFNFMGAAYSSEWLCQRPDLLGKPLWIHIEDEDDARWAMVSTQDGVFLGAVRAAPPWHLSPHTIYMRSVIKSLHKKRLLFLSNQCDAVEELIKYSEGSKDGKLPVHPSYLEARRVLQKHAEKLAEQSMVSHARTSSVESLTPPPAVPPTARKPSPPKSHAPKDAKDDANESRATFPQMQIAKTW